MEKGTLNRPQSIECVKIVKWGKVYSILLIFLIREKQPQKASSMPLRPLFYIYQLSRTLQEDDYCIQNDRSLSMQSFNWKRYKTCYTTYVSLRKVTFYCILPPINASCGTSILQCNYKLKRKQTIKSKESRKRSFSCAPRWSVFDGIFFLDLRGRRVGRRSAVVNHPCPVPMNRKTILVSWLVVPFLPLLNF